MGLFHVDMATSEGEGLHILTWDRAEEFINLSILIFRSSIIWGVKNIIIITSEWSERSSYYEWAKRTMFLLAVTYGRLNYIRTALKPLKKIQINWDKFLLRLSEANEVSISSHTWVDI